MSIRDSRETLGTDRPAPGAADSVQRGDGVQPGPQPQGTRSCADPSPPVASLLQLPPLNERTLYPRISLPPARTSHWIPNRCQFGGGGVAWRQPGGFRTQGGRGRGGRWLSITGHAPPAHAHSGAAQVGRARVRPACGKRLFGNPQENVLAEGARLAAHASSGTNRIEKQPSASGGRGREGGRWRRTEGAGSYIRC